VPESGLAAAEVAPRGAINEDPSIDDDVNAARILLHRATIVARSGELPPELADAVPEGPPGTLAARIWEHRASHRRLVAHHLEVLRLRFVELAGCEPPQAFSDRGGRPPELPGAGADAPAVAGLTSEIRRAEWVAYGLDAVLSNYADRAAQSAGLVRDARDALRQWARLAQADVLSAHDRTAAAAPAAAPYGRKAQDDDRMAKTHCPNFNHNRHNAPVRCCPACGKSVNAAIAAKACPVSVHDARRRQRDAFCVDCGAVLRALR
jgi:hypothetical protein